MTSKHKNPKHNNPAQNNPNNDEGNPFDIEQKETNENQGSQAEEERIMELESDLSELKEKHLRLLAEFDNYKKRTSRERYELLNTASKDVLLALLPVIDDFERALKIGEASQEEGYAEGVRMIYSRLLNILQTQGLKAMESTGQTFDADLHEAITEVPADNPSLKGKVIDTIEKGYFLHDKIIRHAKVVVGN